MAPPEGPSRSTTTSEASSSFRPNSNHQLRSNTKIEHRIIVVQDILLSREYEDTFVSTDPVSFATNTTQRLPAAKTLRSTLHVQIVGTASDAMFGTRSYTAGARMQLPRKVPLRVEPKSFFGEPTRLFPFPPF
jgi:hypothetical protein